MLKSKLAAAAAFAASIALPAHAATQTPCVSADDARILTLQIMPILIDKATERCGASLPATAYLPRSGAALVQRYRAAAEPSWPAAKAMLVRLLADQKIEDTGLDLMQHDEVLRLIMSEAIGQEVAKDIKDQDCGKIDRFVASVGSIPTEHATTMVSAILVLVLDKKGSKPSPICPAA